MEEGWYPGDIIKPILCVTEWKKGGIPVTLTDEDSSTLRWEGWKRINTLQHYRVHDMAECALIRRYQTIKSPNGSLDTSVVSVNSSMPILRSESDTGTKFFHLVRLHSYTMVKKYHTCSISVSAILYFLFLVVINIC